MAEIILYHEWKCINKGLYCIAEMNTLDLPLNNAKLCILWWTCNFKENLVQLKFNKKKWMKSKLWEWNRNIKNEV